MSGKLSQGSRQQDSNATACQDCDVVPNSAADELDNILAHIGATVAARRLEMKLTQEQLALRAGCASATVHLVENARRNVTFRSLASLAHALGLRIVDLLPISQANQPPRQQHQSSSELMTDLKSAQEALKRIEQLLQGGPRPQADADRHERLR